MAWTRRQFAERRGGSGASPQEPSGRRSGRGRAYALAALAAWALGVVCAAATARAQPGGGQGDPGPGCAWADMLRSYTESERRDVRYLCEHKEWATQNEALRSSLLQASLHATTWEATKVAQLFQGLPPAPGGGAGRGQGATGQGGAKEKDEVFSVQKELKEALEGSACTEVRKKIEARLGSQLETARAVGAKDAPRDSVLPDKLECGGKKIGPRDLSQAGKSPFTIVAPKGGDVRGIVMAKPSGVEASRVDIYTLEAKNAVSLSSGGREYSVFVLVLPNESTLGMFVYDEHEHRVFEKRVLQGPSGLVAVGHRHDKFCLNIVADLGKKPLAVIDGGTIELTPEAACGKGPTVGDAAVTKGKCLWRGRAELVASKDLHSGGIYVGPGAAGGEAHLLTKEMLTPSDLVCTNVTLDLSGAERTALGRVTTSDSCEGLGVSKASVWLRAGEFLRQKLGSSYVDAGEWQDGLQEYRKQQGGLRPPGPGPSGEGPKRLRQRGNMDTEASLALLAQEFQTQGYQRLVIVDVQCLAAGATRPRPTYSFHARLLDLKSLRESTLTEFSGPDLSKITSEESATVHDETELYSGLTVPLARLFEEPHVVFEGPNAPRTVFQSDLPRLDFASLGRDVHGGRGYDPGLPRIYRLTDDSAQRICPLLEDRERLRGSNATAEKALTDFGFRAGAVGQKPWAQGTAAERVGLGQRDLAFYPSGAGHYLLAYSSASHGEAYRCVEVKETRFRVWAEIAPALFANTRSWLDESTQGLRVTGGVSWKFGPTFVVGPALGISVMQRRVTALPSWDDVLSPDPTRRDVTGNTVRRFDGEGKFPQSWHRTSILMGADLKWERLLFGVSNPSRHPQAMRCGSSWLCTIPSHLDVYLQVTLLGNVGLLYPRSSARQLRGFLDGRAEPSVQLDLDFDVHFGGGLQIFAGERNVINVGFLFGMLAVDDWLLSNRHDDPETYRSIVYDKAFVGQAVLGWSMSF